MGCSDLLAARGQIKSRLRNPASTVARRAAVVDKHLADVFEGNFPMLDRRGGPRGAAWSKMNPGRGLGLKKQMSSDCDFRNLRRVDDGAGVCRADRIAAAEAIRSYIIVAITA